MLKTVMLQHLRRTLLKFYSLGELEEDEERLNEEILIWVEDELSRRKAKRAKDAERYAKPECPSVFEGKVVGIDRGKRRTALHVKEDAPNETGECCVINVVEKRQDNREKIRIFPGDWISWESGVIKWTPVKYFFERTIQRKKGVGEGEIWDVILTPYKNK